MEISRGFSATLRTSFVSVGHLMETLSHHHPLRSKPVIAFVKNINQMFSVPVMDVPLLLLSECLFPNAIKTEPMKVNNVTAPLECVGVQKKVENKLVIKSEDLLLALKLANSRTSLLKAYN